MLVTWDVTTIDIRLELCLTSCPRDSRRLPHFSSVRSVLERCCRVARAGEGQLERKGSLLHQIFSYLNCEKLTANCRRWHGAKWSPNVCWQNKYLLPGVAAVVICGTMHLWFHILLTNLFAALATKPVAGQCPSYTEYSKVGTSGSCLSTVLTRCP